MRAALLSATAIAIALASPVLAEEKEYPATLAGQAVLPANSTVPAPADAPEHLKQAGKFTTPDRKRAEALGTVPGKDSARVTHVKLPLDGQPLQGFSGIKAMDDGTFWVLSDNGFGNKLNSSDAALMLHHIRLDWQNGGVERLDTVFLTDPDKVVPFPIAMEGANARYLTGADFDIESIQPVADGFWIGDEFGPYLLKVDRQGRLQAVHETMVDGKPVKSPDHPTLTTPANPKAPMPSFNLKRSGGYEGMAISPDGNRLYALLEAPLFTAEGNVETVDGNPALRIIEFDIAKGDWTGRSWTYPLSKGGEAIGDFNMINETTGLVIERDNGAGMADKACADPANPQPDCFDKPAAFKRIYKIALTADGKGEPVRKIGYIDLLAIKDPNGKARQGASGGVYTMPFVTIENVDVIDDAHIVVGNDNNLPFSAGRTTDKADDNEFVLLEVGEFLKAE
ncbi:esterase-like activity of phytase family protein [Rhodoligotrophos defluvii]|uniref:esterase-like activity of phytase family protein n=1 Tax=Rhodoligotrophos defluvii TaxID=2561934 RepID=UPI0010CA018C|nr:esterase-like activity of phytase family protein [Rhodoligotrophos defluvii]